jgi:hypothetical protein
VIDRDALAKMTPDEVAAAVADGSLDHVLGGSRAASANADMGARGDGTLTQSIRSWSTERLGEAVSDPLFVQTILRERELR